MAVRTWDGNDATTPNDWSVTGNWVEGSVPVSTDDVIIPAGSANITAGLNQSAVTLGSLVLERFSGDIGTSSGYLQVAVSGEFRVDCIGGQQFIDIGASAISPIVDNSAGARSGERGFNILGSAIATLVVNSGSVGVAIAPSDSATVTSVKALGGNVWVGENVTLTNLYAFGGDVRLQCAATLLELNGSRVSSYGTGAITTVTSYSGNFTPMSTGTITTLNVNGGVIDFNRTSAARTVTTLNLTVDSRAVIYTDPDYVTLSTVTLPADRRFNLSVDI